ncbi:MAG: hypothetical protein L7H00_04085 [Vulcanisaeta sp.]|nr:hypothetical protein [Vulcanisaeta sp.]MCG2895408.1 hypothetical protein [Vulcanisaeta sp.]
MVNMMVAHMHQVEISFHFNLQRVLREYLVKEWEGQGKKYYVTPVTSESPFEKVLTYLECPHKYPNLPPNESYALVIRSPELMEWYEKVGKNREFQQDVFDHEVCKQPMPEDEEELLRAIYGVVDRLKEDVYYALVNAVVDRVLKPLRARYLDKGWDTTARDIQESIDEVLGVAREAVKVERNFMALMPQIGFIRFDLPATERGVVKEEKHMDPTALQIHPFPNSVNIYLLNWGMYNEIMKLLYKAEQEGLFYVSTPGFYIPTPRIEMPPVIRCEMVERPLPRPPRVP